MSNESQVLDQEMISDNETEIFQEYDMENDAVTNATDESSVNNVPNILRTPSDGCFEIYDGYWGKYIRPCFDPEANVEISDEHLEKFEVNPNLNKVPAELWARWVKLCFHFVDKVKSSVEVSVRILRSEEDHSQYKILVPRQVVSGAAVRVDSFDESIDIETGEEYKSYPPQGWIPVGSSHSHNTMPAFFSGTDDKYELGDPGIHIVVGGIKVNEMKYEIAASVVGSGRRFKISYQELIDATPVETLTFHPKVIEYVDYESPVYSTPTGIAKSNYSWSSNQNKKDAYSYNQWLRQYSGGYDDKNVNYKDPFYYNGSKYYDPADNSSTVRDIKFWEIEDLTVDYLKQSQGDINKLFSILDFMQGTAKDIEAMIDDLMYVHQSE
jgi:hypothetical protein